jgi:hypothetical protein
MGQSERSDQMDQQLTGVRAAGSGVRPFRGWLTKAPEFKRSGRGVAVFRLLVVGKAAGPASKPPSVNVYLSGTEAVRCGLGLHEGDLIEGVGALKPQRKRASRREVVVKEERVILRARAGVAA